MTGIILEQKAPHDNLLKFTIFSDSRDHVPLFLGPRDSKEIDWKLAAVRS